LWGSLCVWKSEGGTWANFNPKVIITAKKRGLMAKCPSAEQLRHLIENVPGGTGTGDKVSWEGNMDGPQFRLLIEFRCDESGCVWAANDAAHARFPTGPIERYYSLPLTTKTRQLLRKLHAQSDGHTESAKSPRSARERERFERRVRMAVAAVQAELGPQYEVEYTEG
jgi:hypothetical protein